MTQDEIIETAIQAGLNFYVNDLTEKQYIEVIKHFVKLIEAKEREAIWNILFEYAGRDDLTPEDESLLKHLADLIKARGQE